MNIMSLVLNFWVIKLKITLLMIKSCSDRTVYYYYFGYECKDKLFIFKNIKNNSEEVLVYYFIIPFFIFLLVTLCFLLGKF